MADATTTPAPNSSRAAFVFILVMVAFDFLAFGIIAPVLPDLIRSFEGGDFARASSIGGYFGLAWATMQFIFSPLLGAWSDRFGRRPVILISCFGLSIDYVFMAVAPSLRWLLVGRIISGITTSNVSTAFAYVTDVTKPEERAKPFGMISAAFGLGFVIGPAVGGWLGNMNLRFPFWAAAALSFGNALYGYFVLPESLPPERRRKLPGPCGSLRRGCFWYAGRSICETLWRTAQPSGGLVIWDDRLRRLRARDSRLDDAGGDTLYCALGYCCSRHTIVDVSPRGPFLSGQVARSHKLPSGDHWHGGTSALHADLCGCHLAALWSASGGGAVRSGGGAPGRQHAAGGVCDPAERSQAGGSTTG